MNPYLSPWLRKKFMPGRLEEDAPAIPSTGTAHLDRINTLAPWGTFVGEHRSRNDEDTEGWLHQGEYNNADRMRRHAIEIDRETSALRIVGKLAPFVEGEGIGVYVVLPQPVSLAPSHDQLMEEQREALLLLRDRNNRIMKQVLKGLAIPLAWFRMFNPIRRTR